MAATGVTVFVYRERLAKMAANMQGHLSDMYIKEFKIGEGNFSDTPLGWKPNPPTGNEDELVATIPPTGACSANDTSGLLFSKEVTSVQEAGGVVDVVCTLADLEDGCDDNSKLSTYCTPPGTTPGESSPPRFFELGLFNNADEMIVYATFDEVVKNSGQQVTFNIQITY